MRIFRENFMNGFTLNLTKIFMNKSADIMDELKKQRTSDHLASIYFAIHFSRQRSERKCTSCGGNPIVKLRVWIFPKK